MKTLFKNADILLREKDGYVTLKNAYLGVNDQYIDYIGKQAPNDKYDIEKDYSNKLLMAGLYNCHTHSPMVFMRAIADGVNLQQWLYDKIFPIEGKMTSKEIAIASKLAIMEMIASGTVSFSDMYFFPEETIKAVVDSGIKANINHYVLAFDDNEKPQDNIHVKQSLELYEKYNNEADGRVKIDFSIHAEYTDKPQVVEYYSNLCKQHQGNMHIHLAETFSEEKNCQDKYGLTTTQWFEKLGTFDSNCFAAHCVACSDDDLDILAKHNVSVVHNPSSNLKLGSGIAPIRKMLDKGINVTIGTDGAASNNNLNMFEEMHLVSLIHNGYNNDPLCINKNQLLDMVTINGAKLQNRSDCGSIEIGKKADIIAIDKNRIHLTPCFDEATLLVSSVQGSDVCLNMVDGRILYEDGKFLTMDKETIIKEFNEVINQFYSC